MNTLTMASLTDVGRRRTDNQDTFICSTLWSESSALLAVIDGVGGYAGGDRAAAIAKESIEQYMAKPNGDALSMLREAVVYANNQIDAQRRQNPRLAQMCCVLTAVVADCEAGQLYFAHVGDTRLYRYRKGTLEKLTHDHSAVGAREDANELTEKEAMRHPRRNEIMREVGLTAHRVDDPGFLESGQTDFKPGDQLLLCSDGLTDMITQKQILNVLGQSLPLDEELTELVRLANEQGGHDNVTVVLAQNGQPNAAMAVPTDQSSLPQSRISLPANNDPSPGPAKRQVGALVGCILIGFLAGGLSVFLWDQYRPAGQSSQALADSLRTGEQTGDAAMKGDKRLDSLLRSAYRSQDHRLVLPADTFWLETPLVLSDSLKSIVGDPRLTVLMPADTIRQQPALRVTGSGMVRIENVLIRGFIKDFDIAPGTALRLVNVYFASENFPINSTFQHGTFRDSILSNSRQNRREPIE